MAFVYKRIPDSPVFHVEQQRLATLKDKYQMIQQKTDSLSKKLTANFIPDDKKYRVVLQMDSLPSTERYAGTGGSVPLAEQHISASDKIFPKVYNRIEKLKRQLIVQEESYETILKKSLLRNKRLNHLPAITPVKMNSNIHISSPFGIRTDPFTFLPKFHEGMDFEGPKGTKIYATADGVVALTRPANFGYGNEVLINHGFGYMTRYAHLCKILVKKGQVVKRGDLIGLMGTTGHSTGPHVHYEVRYHNKPLNPKYFFSDDLTPKEFGELVAKSRQQEEK